MHGSGLALPLKVDGERFVPPPLWGRGQAFPASHERAPPGQWEISVEQIHLRMPGLGGTRERKEEKT
jgi:hypothetical protein